MRSDDTIAWNVLEISTHRKPHSKVLQNQDLVVKEQDNSLVDRRESVQRLLDSVYWQSEALLKSVV